MRILITAPLSGVDIGGPTQYAPNLAKEFEELGYKVKIISYDRVEKIFTLYPNSSNSLAKFGAYCVGPPISTPESGAVIKIRIFSILYQKLAFSSRLQLNSNHISLPPFF